MVRELYTPVHKNLQLKEVFFFLFHDISRNYLKICLLKLIENS